MCHMYMTDFACDGPIFLVPLILSYASLPACLVTLLVKIHIFQLYTYFMFYYRERQPSDNFDDALDLLLGDDDEGDNALLELNADPADDDDLLLEMEELLA